MWTVINQTPFSATGYFVRDKHGSEHWCVAARAGFEILSDGSVSAAAEQEPVRLAPTYADSSAAELLAESDLAPFRPKTDVLIVGTVCAPLSTAPSRRAWVQPVRISVGDLTKSAVAFGQRRLMKIYDSWKIVYENPFEPVNLTWKNSLGGPDLFNGDEPAVCNERNPIGMGWSRSLDAAPDGAELDLPLIENPARLFDPRRPLPEPIGFGPLQRTWRPRRDFCGTYDKEWEGNRMPLLPTDFSEDFHQAASSDQIYPGELKGGEVVEIEGLHPDGPYSFRLPRLVFGAAIWFAGERHYLRFRVVALTIDGTARRLDMVWNASLLCNGHDHLVDETTVYLKKVENGAHERQTG